MSVQNLVLGEILLFKHNIDSILLSLFAPKQCFLRTLCVLGLLLVLISLIVCFTTIVMTAKGSPYKDCGSRVKDELGLEEDARPSLIAFSLFF